MQAIITNSEVSTLARPCYADSEILARIIAEAEREDLKPRIGDKLYLAYKDEDITLTGEQSLLLNGGTFVAADGSVHYLTGIKTALAYFVYARVVRDGNIQSTRYGARVKNDENSSASEKEERQRQYRQAFASADAYMAECLAYMNANADKFEGCRRVMTSNRAVFRVLGAETPAKPAIKPVVSVSLGSDTIILHSEEIRVEGNTLIFEPNLN